MSDPRWDDDRLRRALEARTSGPPPVDLVDEVLGRVQAGRSLASVTSPTRRWALTLISAAAAVALVASVVVMRPLPSPAVGDASSPPAASPATRTTPDPSGSSSAPSPNPTRQKVWQLSDAQSDIVNAYAREHRDVFGGMYIDAWGDRAFVVLFTRNADTHLAALEELLPSLLVRTRTVRFTEMELHALQQRIGDADWLQSIGFRLYSSSINVMDNVVELTGGSNDPGVAERIYDRYGSKMLRVVVHPIAAEPDQPQSGPGWRLLAELERGEPYTVEVATTESELDRMARGLDIERPDADPAREIIIRFSPAISSSCKQVHFAGIVVETDRLYGDISFPIPTGMGCTADAAPYAFVVAVERSVLPPSPFEVHLFDEPVGDPAGQIVEVDLRPVPTPSPDEDARSDLFWEQVTDFGPYGLTYDSLADITRKVHLVVRGRLVGLTSGSVEAFGEDVPPDLAVTRQTLGVVEIDEVLKGEPLMKSPGTVQVAGLGDGMTVAELPDDEVILFLMNHAQLRQEQGVLPAEDPDDVYYYARPNGYQGVLRNSVGRVEIVEGPRGAQDLWGPFPWVLDEEPFDEVVERVRKIVAETD